MYVLNTDFGWLHSPSLFVGALMHVCMCEYGYMYVCVYVYLYTSNTDFGWLQSPCLFVEALAWTKGHREAEFIQV